MTVPGKSPVAGVRSPAWGAGAPAFKVTSQEALLELQEEGLQSWLVCPRRPAPPCPALPSAHTRAASARAAEPQL